MYRPVFSKDLKKRGLTGARLIISDTCLGLAYRRLTGISEKRATLRSLKLQILRN